MFNKDLLGRRMVGGRSYLRDTADGVDLANQLAVRLKEQQELEVEFVEPLTELQLLRRRETNNNTNKQQQ